MPELNPEQANIEKYHVPLIIYSPMLKGPKKFESVATHHNLTPSILARMRENCEMGYSFFIV